MSDYLTGAMGALRTLISRVPAYQSWCSRDNAGDTHDYHTVLFGDGASPPIRPMCVIGVAGGESQREITGDTGGVLTVYVEDYIDAADVEEDSHRLADVSSVGEAFIAHVAELATGMRALGQTAGNLLVASVALLTDTLSYTSSDNWTRTGPAAHPAERVVVDGAFISMQLKVTYGVTA